MAELSPNIIFLILGVIIVILVIWLVFMELRIRRIFRGKNAGSLEAVIGDLHKAVALLEENHSEASRNLSLLQNRVERSIQGVNTIRFNPFQGEGQGGNHSFATAFINGLGDGVIISSIYSRGQVRTFAKPIKNFGSAHELSEEETKILADLKNS